MSRPRFLPFVVAAIAGFAAIFGCSGALPSPPSAPHAHTDFRDVPTPPPTPRSEELTARPAGSNIWLDGEWTWRLGRWSWTSGGWVAIPAGVTLAKWTFTRQPTGTIRWAPSLLVFPDGRREEIETVLQNIHGGPVVPPACVSSSAPTVAFAPPIEAGDRPVASRLAGAKFAGSAP